MDRAPALRELLRYSVHPLEFYRQTALWNSPLRDVSTDPDDEFGSSMRLIDWRRGWGSSPYVFRDDDFDLLSTSDRLFARKFRADVDQRAQRGWLSGLVG